MTIKKAGLALPARPFCTWIRYEKGDAYAIFFLMSARRLRAS